MQQGWGSSLSGLKATPAKRANKDSTSKSERLADGRRPHTPDRTNVAVNGGNSQERRRALAQMHPEKG